MRLRIVTVLWGGDFVDRILNLTFRSLAAAGNLPDLVRRYDVIYELYAPNEDIERIRAAPIYAELAKIVEFRCHPLAVSDIDVGNAMSHWTVWHWAIAAARRDDVHVILVAPDHVFCRGAMMRWAELLDRGYLAIFCPGVQVAIETLARELETRFPGGRPIDLSLADLRDLMFRHLHPIKIAMTRGSPRSIGHPEWHLRAIPGQGLIQKILASHAVAFHPGRIGLSETFGPTEQFERVAFEPSWFLGGEPLLKYLGLYLRPRPFDDATLSYYGVWGDRFTSAVSILESRITHNYAIGAALAEDAERRHRRGAEFFVAQMHASRAIVRVWRSSREAGLYQAARWLAAAHLHARLRRRLPIRPPMTLLVPSDDVLTRLDPSEAGRLLASDGDELIAILRAHVVPGRLALAPGDRLAESRDGTIGAMGGKRFAAGRRGTVRILRGPIRIDDIDVYVIDQLLAPLSLRPPAARDLLGTMRRALDHASRRGIQKGKEIVLALLSRDRHLLMFVLNLREALRRRWQATKHAIAGTRPRYGSKWHPAEVTPVDPDAARSLRRAVAARGLDAINELYAFYSSNVLDGSSIVAAPAARLAQIPSASGREISAWLEDAVKRSPGFAEAWIELGFLRKEAGEENGAIDAFDRCRNAMPAFPRRLGRPDVRAIATIERALLLARRGQSEEALAQLDAIPDRRWLPWTYHLTRARLLLAAKRTAEALAAFEHCLEWTSIESLIDAPLPDRIHELEQILGGEPDLSAVRAKPLTA